MNKRTFSKYVKQIKENIVLVEDQKYLSNLSGNSYGNFYGIALDILSEVFEDKKHKQILLEMFDEYKQTQRFRMDYIVNGKSVITPVELYEAVNIEDDEPLRRIYENKHEEGPLAKSMQEYLDNTTKEQMEKDFQEIRYSLGINDND